MRENRISVFRKHTLGILVALGMVLFGSVFILFTNIGKNKATVAAEETLQFIKEQSSRSEAFAEFYQGLHLEMNGIIMICKNGLVTGSKFLRNIREKTQAEAPLIQNITEETEPDTLFSFRYYGSAYFGVFESYGENDLYVFYPVASVFLPEDPGISLCHDPLYPFMQCFLMAASERRKGAGRKGNGLSGGSFVICHKGRKGKCS